eukprot:365190-Chlamydomonas_euryale.AAC.14
MCGVLGRAAVPLRTSFGAPATCALPWHPIGAPLGAPFPPFPIGAPLGAPFPPPLHVVSPTPHATMVSNQIQPIQGGSFSPFL